MTGPDYYLPPRYVPVHVKYLLGLARDASLQEVKDEWVNQIVPLMNVGPQFLFDREANQIMAGGITGDQARRIFKQTKRGAQLWNAIDREGKARARANAATPPFTKEKI